MLSKINVFVFIVVFVCLISIINLLKKRKLNLTYSLLWLAACVILLFAIIFPQTLVFISSIIGVYALENTVYIIQAIFILAILISLTVIASKQNEKNYKLAQNQAILDYKLRSLEKIKV